MINKKHLLNKLALALIMLQLIALQTKAQTFEEQTSIPLPQISYGSVAWGDYDNDGDLDILITGVSSSRIYRNNGNNTFTFQIEISLIGVAYSSVAWGDYDNDGDLDILITGQSSSGMISKVYKNNGNNTFTEQTGISLAGVTTSSVAWGDYDNDGDLDILLTGYSISGDISKIYKNNGDNTFTEQTRISLTGVLRGSAAWGDYDNDGDLDILLTGYTDPGTISKIYTNNGDNTFTEQTGISLAGVYDSSVAWGDYDSDGDLDILLTGAGKSKIYRNNGDNTFTDQIEIALTEVYESSVAWGDYDNDGDLDILLTGNTNSSCVSKIYKNNGDNTFTEQAGIALTGVNYSSVAWGDYDNDGDLDILLTGSSSVGSTYNTTKIYKNLSTTSNTAPDVPVNLISEVQGNKVVLNWDKASDTQTPQNGLSYNVYVSTVSNKDNVKACMSNLTNGYRKVNQMGNAGQKNSYSVNLVGGQTYYWSVQAIDNGFAGGAFAAEKSFTVPITRPTTQASDFIQSDSKSAQTTISWKNGNGTNRVVFVKLGTGTPPPPVDNTTYAANTTFGLGSELGTGWYCVSNDYANSLTIKGLQPGNSYQILVYEYDGSAGTELYNSAISTNVFTFNTNMFEELTGFSFQGLSCKDAKWGDYDNDGDLDLLLTTTARKTKVFKNNGDNTFSEQTGIVLPDLNDVTVVWGDYNSDGYLDIVINGSEIIKVFQNNRDNTFTELPGLTLGGGNGIDPELGDYNNDGKLDILETGSTGSAVISKLYRNNGDNTFTLQNKMSFWGISWDGSTFMKDFDNDGHLDVLLYGYEYPYWRKFKFFYYHNNGDSTFTWVRTTNLPDLSGTAACGDYNNDGFLDLLVSYKEGTTTITKVFKNNGNNTFSAQDIALGYNSKNSWCDYNNDGLLDISTSKLYKNNGDNTFTEESGVSIPSNLYDINWGDYDNDGDEDLLLISGGVVKIYRNTTISKTPKTDNTAPAAPTNLTILNSINGDVTFGWDKATDTETPQDALSYNLYVYNSETNLLAKTPHSFRQTELENGKRHIVQRGDIRYNPMGYTLYNLPSGRYKWSVQAIDGASKGGEFAEEQGSFQVINLKRVGINIAQGILTNTEMTMAYSLNSTDGVNGDWFFCQSPSTPVDFKSGGFDIWVREIAYNVNKHKVATIEGPATPSFTIDFINEQIAQTVKDSVEYSSNADMSGAIIGTNNKPSIKPLQTLYFRIKASEKKVTSAIQSLTAPAQPAAPTFTINCKQETTAEPISSSYEYSSNADMSGASRGYDTKVPITLGQTIYFRKKATSTEFKSLIQELKAVRPPAPNFTINYIEEKTNEIATPSIEYSWNNFEFTYIRTGSNNKINIIPDSDLLLKVRTKLSETAFDSEIQSISMPKRPAAPTSPVVDDGKNTFDWTYTPGFTNATDYEYSIDGGISWINVTTKPINVGAVNIEAAKFYIRVKATETNFKGTHLVAPKGFTLSTASMEDLGIEVFPNPAMDVLAIKNVPSKGSLFIYSVDGVLLKTAELEPGTNHIGIQNLAKGIYILTVQMGETKAYSRVVKQ